MRAFSTPFLLPSRLYLPFVTTFVRITVVRKKVDRNTNTAILLLCSTRFERKKNGKNYLISKGRESSNPRGGDESRRGWCTRWKAVWMNDEQHQRERGRGGGPRSPPPRVGSKRLSSVACDSSVVLPPFPRQRTWTNRRSGACTHRGNGEVVGRLESTKRNDDVAATTSITTFSTQHHQRSGAHARET